MNYEKAYKGARERCRWQLANKFISEECATDLFRDIKESENERIRKEIIRIVDIWTNSSPVVNGIPRENLLAYLERMKDLTAIPDELVKSYRLFYEYGGRELALFISAINGFNKLKESQAIKRNAEDEKIRQALLRCCDDWDKGQFGCMEKEDIPSIRAWLEKQKEQKPAEVNVKALLTADRLASTEMTGRLKERTEILENPEKYGLCKPAEWSAEDERMLSRCVKSVECSKEFCETETFKDAKDVEKDWLKSLPERFKLQPKQEWSEEDEEIWKEIFGLCNRFGYDDACRKLRTIRPQPHWKPSEEQMEALRAAMEHNVCYCGCNHHALKSLYNDLQNYSIHEI